MNSFFGKYLGVVMASLMLFAVLSESIPQLHHHQEQHQCVTSQGQHFHTEQSQDIARNGPQFIPQELTDTHNHLECALCHLVPSLQIIEKKLFKARSSETSYLAHQTRATAYTNQSQKRPRAPPLHS